MKATPEQLRAMWAAIPGVDFNPKRPHPPQPHTIPLGTNYQCFI